MDLEVSRISCKDEVLPVWNVTTGNLLRTFTHHQTSVWQVRFSPDQITLVRGIARIARRSFNTVSSRVQQAALKEQMVHNQQLTFYHWSCKDFAFYPILLRLATKPVLQPISKHFTIPIFDHNTRQLKTVGFLPNEFSHTGASTGKPSFLNSSDCSCRIRAIGI